MELLRIERISLPVARLIGRRYGDDDRVDNLYAHLWGRREAATIREALMGLPAAYDGMLGYMRMAEEEFEYWIGKLCPADTQAPDGLDFVDIPARDVAVAALRATGEEAFVRAHHTAVVAMEGEGWTGIDDGWFGECFPADIAFSDADEPFSMEYHITIAE